MVKPETTSDIYIDIILKRISRIEMYTKDVSIEEYLDNLMMQDACERNLEIIGDSCRQLIEREKVETFELEKSVRKLFKEVYDTRNFLSHGYDTPDEATVYYIIKDDIPDFKKIINKLKEDL